MKSTLEKRRNRTFELGVLEQHPLIFEVQTMLVHDAIAPDAPPETPAAVRGKGDFFLVSTFDEPLGEGIQIIGEGVVDRPHAEQDSMRVPFARRSPAQSRRAEHNSLLIVFRGGRGEHEIEGRRQRAEAAHAALRSLLRRIFASRGRRNALRIAGRSRFRGDGREFLEKIGEAVEVPLDDPHDDFLAEALLGVSQSASSRRTGWCSTQKTRTCGETPDPTYWMAESTVSSPPMYQRQEG